MSVKQPPSYLNGKLFKDFWGSSQERSQYSLGRIGDAIDDFLINSKQTEYRAKCISGLESGENSIGINSTSGFLSKDGTGANKCIIKVRRFGMEDKFFYDPYANTTDEEKEGLIEMHPWAESESTIEGDDGSIPGAGAILIVREEPDGRLIWRLDTGVNQEESMLNPSAGEKSLQKVFSGANVSTMGDYHTPVPKYPKQSTESFLRLLKASPSFYGWSGAALAGVAANAYAESAYKKLVGGDPVSYYQKARNAGKISQSKMDNVKKRAVNGKCSWGYWQLNICPESAGGTRLIKELGIDIMTKEGKEKWLKALDDNETQFSFVAGQLVSMGFDTATNDPYDFGYYMTTKFERPVNKEQKGKERGALARDIYNKYKSILDAG